MYKWSFIGLLGRSCLSEYIRVEAGGGAEVRLCHSNVTVPVLVGDTETSGAFQPSSPVWVTLHWAGTLDRGTQYLGRSA